MRDKYRKLILLPFISAFALGINANSTVLPIEITNEINDNANNRKCTISGIITDSKTKEPLTGATIQIEGTNFGTIADIDGNFDFQNLNPGKYRLNIKYIAYQDVTVEAQVSPTSKTFLEIQLVDESISLDAVAVVATRKLNNEMSLLKTVREGMVIQTGVSSQQITKTQDSDASAVIRRIPGVSLIENKFVMVRGLSQRYNNVWINNNGVPSSEADSRAFSFDIIPSSQLDNMMVIKTQVPEIPADFSGGFVKIQTKDVPEKNSFSFSIGTSVNDQTHFSDSYILKGSKTDFLGFDNGYRSKNVDFVNRLNNNNASEVTEFSKNGLNNNWKLTKFTPYGDIRINSSLNRFIETESGKQYAMLAALNYTNASKSYTDMTNARYSVYNNIYDRPEYYFSYNDQRYDQNVKLGGMLNLTFIPRQGDKYEFKNIINQNGINRYTHREGTQFTSGEYKHAKDEYYYMSRTTYSGQFTGTYNRSMSKLDWSLGYSYANKITPDRRVVKYNENGFPEDKNFGKMEIDQNDISREFTRLDENIYSATTNYKRDFSFLGIMPTVKTGLYAEYRDRKYRNRNFYYRWYEDNLHGDFGYGDLIDDIMIDSNFGADKLYVYDDTDNTNNYDGNNILGAGYLALNIPLNKINIYGGVRYEYNRKELVTYKSVKGNNTKSDFYTDNSFFPSLNMTYKMNDLNQFRAAFGTSVNRPEFREVSSSVYNDFELYSDVMGNPKLKTAYIKNFDIAYEIYPSDNETVTLSLFYKNFRNPIEWTYIDTGGDYTFTFENAKSADSYGIELEIKKNLDFIGLKNFSVNFNGAIINSKVKFDKNSQEKERPMQGQSPYLINTGLFYQNPDSKLTCGVLYNRIGKRIIGVGRVLTSDGASNNNNIPDSYEMPRNVIDVVFSKRFKYDIEFKAAVNDVIGETLYFKQFPEFIDANGITQKREQITKSYRPGRNFNISISKTF